MGLKGAGLQGAAQDPAVESRQWSRGEPRAGAVVMFHVNS